MADALGSISAGPLSITEGQTYTDNISNSFDVDYFKLPASLFTVPSQIDVSFGGSFSSKNNLFTVSIVDQSDTNIATVSSGVPITISGSVAAGSAYYLKVAQAESLDTTSYTLSYDLHPGVIITGNSSDALIKENSLTNQALTASIIGTPSADVNVIVDAPEGLTISGSNISVVDAAANTYVLTLNSTTTSDTFTVSAANSVNSGTATLQYSTVSSDSAFNALSIPSTNFTVEENIATFTISDITYSSSSGYVSEGSTTTATYTVTANGLTSNDDLELILSASGLEFSSATSFNLTQSSPSATIVVTADDDTTIEAGSNSDGIHAHAVTHAINENGSVSSTYLNSISNKSISVADNDDTSSAKSVSISDASASTTTSIPDNITVNLIDSSAASTSFTSSSGSILAASDLTITHVALVNQASVYTSDVAISDVVLQLRDIVGLQTLTGAAKEAADVNNDGSISISDVVSSLRDIVGLEAITTFDLVDSSGARVSQVGPSMSDSTLTLVQNGDVDLSGSFIIA